MKRLPNREYQTLEKVYIAWNIVSTYHSFSNKQ